MALEFHDIRSPDDPDLTAFHDLLARVFDEPELTIPLATLRRLVRSQADAELMPHCLVLKEEGQVAGGSAFRYVPGANTAFSGYLALDPALRGRGYGRRLTDERMRILVADAADHGHTGPDALFIDVANPDRMSPAEYAHERDRIMDPRQRRTFMGHLGFRQVLLEFRPLPWAPGEPQPAYLDLLVLPLHPDWAARAAVPGDVVVATLGPIWRRINPAAAAAHLADLERQVGGRWVGLSGEL